MKNFYHVVIQGKQEYTRAFIEGVIVGGDAFGSLYFLDDLDVEHDSLLGQIRELISGEDMTTILIEGSLFDLVKKGISDLSQDLNLTIKNHHKVKEATFSYKVKCYSKEHGVTIKKLFEELPDGASLSPNSELEEKTDPSAKGVEMYAAAHDYELSGKGKVTGNAASVLQVYSEAVKEPLITLGKIEFTFE